MKLAFTLCSINYLAQAQNLFDSVKRTNPDWKCVIGVVDKNTTQIDLSFITYDIVWVEELNIEGWTGMVDRYTIVELLTSVKPFYFTYLFNRYPEVDKIAYFDPDIMLFDSLGKMEDELDQYDIILTPHMTTPITDGFLPTELHVKRTGVYNLGFVAVKRSENTFKMLDWWSKRLHQYCYINFSKGLFVDQGWMDIVPAFFDKVLISKYPGYNMAHWNLHERILELKNGKYYVNEEPLVFYHFSHYKPSNPTEIAAYHTRYSFETREDLVGIYQHYHEGLLNAHFFELVKTPCYYVRDEKKKKSRRDLENKMNILLPNGIKKILTKYYKR